MQFRHWLVGSAFLVLLAGCRPTVSPSGRQSIEVAPAETYTHAPSRFSFPPRVGNFAREAVTQYDREGLDVSVGYNLAVGIFGGGAPLIATYLIDETGNLTAPSFYLMAACSVTLVTLLFLPESRGTSLDRPVEGLEIPSARV